MVRYLVASLVVLTGCIQSGAFVCQVNGDCGSGGICEPGGACSFADPGCASGRRFGKYAPQVGGQCTGSTGGDGGGDGAAGDGGARDGGPADDGGTGGDGGAVGCFSELAAGGSITCVRQGGQAQCWGANDEGELGDGTLTRSSRPVPVAMPTDIVELAPGGYHTCARTGAGAVWCWGDNNYHQIPGAPSSQITMPRLTTGVPVATQLTSGGSNSCVLDAAGTATCWGDNQEMQLGDTMTHRMPFAIPGVPAAAQVVIGDDHGCVLARSPAGTVWCWGANDEGQLGDGTTMPRTAPVQTSITGVVELASGAYHTCARKSDGTVACWGSNEADQLGHRNLPMPYSALPVAVGSLANVVQVSSFSYTTCVRQDTGAVYCWGEGQFGQLGNNRTEYSNDVPQLVQVAPATAIAVGDAHACARTAAGIACWGDDSRGAIGDGALLYSKTPVQATLADVAEVSAGDQHACARINADGSLYCWGTNDYGQLGDNSETPHTAPTLVPGFTGTLEVRAGEQSSCLVGAAHDARCWGYNNDGEVGNNETPPQEQRAPVSVFGLGDVGELTMGSRHVCARKQADGSVWCWGANADLQLGDGTNMARNAPVASLVTGTLPGLAAGVRKTCARTASGGVTCWGNNQYGELGDGTMMARTTPVTVVLQSNGMPLTGVLEVVSGWEHTCARTATQVFCWGLGWEGQLGDGASQPWPAAVEVTGLTATRLFAGGDATCAQTASGLRCWGRNSFGQLGDGTTNNAVRPVAVTAAVTDVVDLAIGGDYACATRSDRSLWCWGLNEEGQLAVGTTLMVKVPVASLVACQ